MVKPIKQEIVWAWARQYKGMGFSLIPCKRDKRPALKSWKAYQHQTPSRQTIDTWFRFDGQRHQSIGVICGTISRLLVIDLDGIEAMKLFYQTWPEMSQRTFTVLTGSGKGCHLYFNANYITDNINVRVPGIGGFEIRGEGQYVVAPPSPHPSGRRYQPIVRKPVEKVQSLEKIRAWMDSLRADPTETIVMRRGSPKRNQQNGNDDPYKRNYLNKVFSEEIARVERASEGERNNSLFYAGLRLANFAAGGDLQWLECESRLLAAALRNGTPESEARRTINSAHNIGWKYPKQVPKATS